MEDQKPLNKEQVEILREVYDFLISLSKKKESPDDNTVCKPHLSEETSETFLNIFTKKFTQNDDNSQVEDVQQYVELIRQSQNNIDRAKTKNDLNAIKKHSKFMEHFVTLLKQKVLNREIKPDSLPDDIKWLLEDKITENDGG